MTADLDRKAAKRSWGLLVVLVLSYACSSIDRTIIVLMIEPIKQSLGLTDSQISYLQGFAFMLVYALMGVPAGILVDRYRRLRVLAGAIAFWSAMTSLCGLSRSFATLFLARAGVGAGESALAPAAYSLLSDAYPKERLGLALGLFNCGGIVGVSVALGGGGMLYAQLLAHGAFTFPIYGELLPWQMLFVLLMLPGILLTLALLALPEPARNHRTNVATGALPFMRERRQVLVPLFIAVSLQTLVAHSVGSWAPSYIIRTLHADIATAGGAVGSAYLFGGIPGLVGGGLLSDWLLRFGSDMRLRVCAGAALAAAAVGTSIPLISSIEGATIAIAIIVACSSMPLGIATAALQEITPSPLRGRVSAVLFLVISLIGSLGPSIVAWMTDLVFADPNKLYLSLSVSILAMMLGAAIAYGFSLRPYRKFARPLVGDEVTLNWTTG